MNKIILIASVLFLASCDHVPSQVFKVKTVDGTVIKFLCPVIDRDRNALTFVYDNECVIVKDD